MAKEKLTFVPVTGHRLNRCESCNDNKSKLFVSAKLNQYTRMQLCEDCINGMKEVVDEYNREEQERTTD